VSIFADSVPLCSSSTHFGCVAPELRKWVALSKSDTAATESSAAATESRSVTPSDTCPSTPTGNLTTKGGASKGGASKPPTGESAGESARTATPNLGEKPTKKLSAYEIERNKNIARNKELLARLDLQPDIQQPQPKAKVKRSRKAAEPVPESERRHGHSAGKPSMMYVHFHFHYVLP
jgi:hypothetical protein